MYYYIILYSFTYSVKIHDLIELKDVYNIINVDEGYGRDSPLSCYGCNLSPSGKLDQLQWTDDGQILSITTVDGKYRHFDGLTMGGCHDCATITWRLELFEILKHKTPPSI